MLRLLALLLLVALVAPQQTPPTEQRVLFIGNSLTYSNDLPTLVATLARAKSVRVSCFSIEFPNYSLEDHWQRGDAQREIRKGGWSLVVLQQGPSAAPESQVLLREYVKRFDKEIRAVGARTSLYMVWPSRARSQDFDGVIRSYTAAAKDVNAQLFPAGDAWRAVWAKDPSLELYGLDGLHPSPLGTYVAALVIVKTAFGISPQGLPAPGIDAATAKIVQDAVVDRVKEPAPRQTAEAARRAGRGMIEWRPNQNDAGASARNRAGGSAVCERHATVICCTAGAMGDRAQTARTEATVSRVIFAEAATRSSRGQPESRPLAESEPPT